jgi:hypothetical protein
MSDATRAVALSEATKLGLGDAGATLQAAKAYNDFLTADSTGAEPKPAPAPKATAATAAKPATTAKKTAAKAAATASPEDAAAAAGLEAAADADAAADAAELSAEDDGEIPVSREGVQAVIAKMLEANVRKEAIALLKKYGAASATSVKEKDFGKFIADALKLIPAAEESDLTA